MKSVVNRLGVVGALHYENVITIIIKSRAKETHQIMENISLVKGQLITFTYALSHYNETFRSFLKELVISHGVKLLTQRMLGNGAENTNFFLTYDSQTQDLC